MPETSFLMITIHLEGKVNPRHQACYQSKTFCKRRKNKLGAILLYSFFFHPANEGKGKHSFIIKRAADLGNEWLCSTGRQGEDRVKKTRTWS